MALKLRSTFLALASLLTLLHLASGQTNSVAELPPMVGQAKQQVNITCSATLENENTDGVRLMKVLGQGNTQEIANLFPALGTDLVIKDPNKYTATKTGSTSFYVTIKSLAFEDAAYYRCELIVKTEVNSKASLVVLDEPMIMKDANIQVDTWTTINCEADYQKPSDLATDEHLPQMSATLDGAVVDGGVLERTDTKVKMSWNKTFTASDNQKEMICNVNVQTPSFEVPSKAETLNVQFDVQNLMITPEKVNYTVGDIVNCSAEGNPEPMVKWVAKQSKLSGPNIGQGLEIVREMMGEPQEQWHCEASSTLKGSRLEKPLHFYVTVSGTPTPTHPPKSSPVAAIAAGVTVPLVVIIAVVVVVVVFIMRKNKKEAPKKDPEHQQPAAGQFSNPAGPMNSSDNLDGKPTNPNSGGGNQDMTAYQSDKPALPPHQQYPDQHQPDQQHPNSNGHNVSFERPKYDDPNQDMSAMLARRALTPPPEEVEYDTPYTHQGDPRLSDIVTSVPPPSVGPEEYAAVRRPPRPTSDYPDMAAAHPGLQQAFNAPKPKVAVRQQASPADTTV